MGEGSRKCWPLPRTFPNTDMWSLGCPKRTLFWGQDGTDQGLSLGAGQCPDCAPAASPEGRAQSALVIVPTPLVLTRAAGHISPQGSGWGRCSVHPTSSRNTEVGAGKVAAAGLPKQQARSPVS